MAKVIKAVFGAGERAKVCPQWQYDYNTVLQFIGLDLPEEYEVDLSNSSTGQSVTVLGDVDGCTIPAQMFIPGTSIFAWVYIVDETSGYTRAQVEIPISPRAAHTGDDPTPEQRAALDEAIALLNAATEAIPDTIEAALAEAKASGEFDGADGADGSAVWTVDAQYTRDVGGNIQAQRAHLVGPAGATPRAGDLVVVSDGRFGSIIVVTSVAALVSSLGDLTGPQGYSPTVTVTEIEGGHRVTITDEDGDHVFDVMDGTGGGGGTGDYNDLTNRPQINSVTLTGNKTASDLGLAPAGAYVKPSGGIPKTDLASAVQTSLGKADTALQSVPSTYRTAAAQDAIDAAQDAAISAKYTRPSGGIPKTDLASAVQTSLGKADSALQSYTETDPTVPSWAKASSKPSYTASEVGAIAAPASPTNGDVLTYDGSAWGASAPSHQIPSGGNAGECLAKNSASNYDLRWRTINDWTPAGLMRTSGGTAAKAAEWSFWSATQYPAWLVVTVGNSNTYAGAITLKVNGSTVYPIYINGAASSATNYTLPAGSYFVYFDGSKFDFRTDGKLPGDIIGHADKDIAAPASPSTGDFLCWNGSAWAATTLAAWQGGNY